jgi:hypothetical protein
MPMLSDDYPGQRQPIAGPEKLCILDAQDSAC